MVQFCDQRYSFCQIHFSWPKKKTLNSLEGALLLVTQQGTIANKQIILLPKTQWLDQQQSMIHAQSSCYKHLGEATTALLPACCFLSRRQNTNLSYLIRNLVRISTRYSNTHDDESNISKRKTSYECQSLMNKRVPLWNSGTVSDDNSGKLNSSSGGA